MASIHVFEDLESPICLEIIKHMERYTVECSVAKNPRRLRTLFHEQSLHPDASDWQEINGRNSMRLQRVFSKDFIGVDNSLPNTDKASQDSMSLERATMCVQKMTQRLKRDLDEATVLYFKQGESIHQDCTLILMLGQLKQDENIQDEERVLSQERTLRAPAAIPWMAEIDDQILWGEASNTEMASQSSITWRVISQNALVVLYPSS